MASMTLDQMMSQLKKVVDQEYTIEVKLEADFSGFLKSLQLAFSEESMLELLVAFVEQRFSPFMKGEFDERASSRDYLPQIEWVSEAGKDFVSFGEVEGLLTSGIDAAGDDVSKYGLTGPDDPGGASGPESALVRRARLKRMRKGFSRLWGEFTHAMTFATENGVGVGLGSRAEIESIPLYKYMPYGYYRPPLSQANSLFHAIEFGTGISENVGGDQYVVSEGPTKEYPPGAWRYGPATGGGPLHLGQKGFHFLYDARNRRPRQEYFDFVGREFGPFATKHLLKRLNK